MRIQLHMITVHKTLAMEAFLTILSVISEKCKEDTKVHEICKELAENYIEALKEELRYQNALEDNIALKVDVSMLEEIYRIIEANSKAQEELNELLKTFYNEHLKMCFELDECAIEKMYGYDELKIEMESRELDNFNEQLYLRKLKTAQDLEERHIVKQFRQKEKELLEVEQERIKLERQLEIEEKNLHDVMDKKRGILDYILKLVKGSKQLEDIYNRRNSFKSVEKPNPSQQKTLECSFHQQPFRNVGLSSRLALDFNPLKVQPLPKKISTIPFSKGCYQLLRQASVLRKSIQDTAAFDLGNKSTNRCEFKTLTTFEELPEPKIKLDNFEGNTSNESVTSNTAQRITQIDSCLRENSIYNGSFAEEYKSDTSKIEEEILITKHNKDQVAETSKGGNGNALHGHKFSELLPVQKKCSKTKSQPPADKCKVDPTILQTNPVSSQESSNDRRKHTKPTKQKTGSNESMKSKKNLTANYPKMIEDTFIRPHPQIGILKVPQPSEKAEVVYKNVTFETNMNTSESDTSYSSYKISRSDSHATLEMREKQNYRKSKPDIQILENICIQPPDKDFTMQKSVENNNGTKRTAIREDHELDTTSQSKRKRETCQDEILNLDPGINTRDFMEMLLDSSQEASNISASSSINEGEPQSDKKKDSSNQRAFKNRNSVNTSHSVDFENFFSNLTANEDKSSEKKSQEMCFDFISQCKDNDISDKINDSFSFHI